MQRFVLVAGEVSGDLLGAALIRGLRQRFPNAVFEGIGGPAMQAEGFYSFAPMERLSVMGLIEVLGRLPELLKLRKQLFKHYQPEPPTAFIGIDAPDFNLALAAKFKSVGSLAVHFVSPSVWAWRGERVKKIAQQLDLMLTLFPFEVSLYREQGLRVDCVGHPLADRIEFNPSKTVARDALGLALSAPTLAVLPGSRLGEVKRLAPVFAQVVGKIREELPDLQIRVPAANDSLKDVLAAHFQADEIIDGRSHEVMAAADSVLLASGTAALEAGLVGRPMVVAYKLNGLTAWRVKQKLRVEHVSLPNHLTPTPWVPEFLQENCRPTNIVPAVLEQLRSNHPKMMEDFKAMHTALARGAADRAATAIATLVRSG